MEPITFSKPVLQSACISHNLRLATFTQKNSFFRQWQEPIQKTKFIIARTWYLNLWNRPPFATGDQLQTGWNTTAVSLCVVGVQGRGGWQNILKWWINISTSLSSNVQELWICNRLYREGLMTAHYVHTFKLLQDLKRQRWFWMEAMTISIGNHMISSAIWNK